MSGKAPPVEIEGMGTQDKWAHKSSIILQTNTITNLTDVPAETDSIVFVIAVVLFYALFDVMVFSWFTI